MERLTLIIPFLNEAEALPRLVARLNDVGSELEQLSGCDLHAVFVDDGSQDDSQACLGAIEDWRFSAETVELSRNFGKEAAILAGLEAAADAAAVVILDADLQHPPEMIVQMVRHWREDGEDVVYAYKADRRDEGLLKRSLAFGFYRLLASGSRFQVPSNAGDFRLMSRRAAAALRRLPERQRFTKGLYAWIGFRQRGLPFEVPPRTAGQSRFGLFDLFSLSMEGITSFTVKPLRYMSAFGCLIATFSIIYMAYILFERLVLGQPIPGFASIIVLIAFFGGLQIFCLGLIGEYVGKTLLETKERPSYIVADRIQLSPGRLTWHADRLASRRTSASGGGLATSIDAETRAAE